MDKKDEGRMTPAEARKFFKKNGVRFILAQFVDIHGSAKTKCVPVEHFDTLLTAGVGFAGFAIWGLGMGPEGPEYTAIGDLNGQRSITGDTALRLGHFFETSAQFWLNLQALHDLRIAEQKIGEAIDALPTLRGRSPKKRLTIAA